MNHKRQNIWRKLMLICFGFLLMTGCEMQADQELLDESVSTTLDTELKAALDIMFSDPENAIKQCDKIIEQANAIPAPYYSGKAKWYQAYIYDEILQDVSKAYFGYNEALKDLRETDDAKIKVDVLNNLGILNQFYTHYDAAINSFNEALTYADDIEPKLRSNVYYNLGSAYKQKGDQTSVQQAEEAFTKSLEIALEIADHQNIASVHHQIGMMYKDMANYDMARIAYNNIIRQYQGSSEVAEYVGKAYHGIGVTYMDEGKFDDAIASFEQALQFKTNSSSIFLTKYDLGTVLRDGGYVNKAVATWKDALNEKHNKNDRKHVQIYAELTSALAANSDFEEAVQYAQTYNEYIGNILSVGDEQKNENNAVIFADIVRDYAEFNQVVPFYKQPRTMVFLLILIAVSVYGFSTIYYRSRMSKKVSDNMSKIQMEFQNIKLD